MKEEIKKLNELLDNIDISFKRFEGSVEYYVANCRFFTIELLPSLSFFIDKQMNETWVDSKGNLVKSYIGIGLTFNWLGLNMYFQINFKTNKPLLNGANN